MRGLIAALILLLLPGAAWGQCSFANPSACGSPGMNNAAVAGTLSAGTIAANTLATPGNTITLSGSTVPTYLGNYIANWAGTSTRTDNTGIAAFHIGASSDNANFNANGGTRDELLISSNYGGASFNGFRQGVMVQMNFNTASTLTRAAGGGGGLEAKVVPSANFGGSSGNYFGSFFGANPWTDCATGATFLSQCVGMEIDGAMQTGASASNFTLLQAVLTSDHATHGINADNGYALVAQVGASAGLYNGEVVGSYGAQWPIDANGYLYKIETSSNYNTHASTAAGGWDWLQAVFTGVGVNGGPFTWRTAGPSSSISATAVDGSGGLKIGSAYLVPTSTTLTLDTGLYSFNGISSVVSGGTNYTGNGSSGSDIVDDGYGNEFYVTASGGVVSALTLRTRAEGRVSTPSVSSLTFNNVVVTGTSPGSGLTVTESAWTQAGTTLAFGTTTATTINIGNSSSTMTLAGTIKAGTSTGVTCPTGSPSASFATVNGIVTHC